MSTARSCYGVAVVDGKLYVVGGVDGSNTIVSSVECLDPSTGQWSMMAGEMSTARAFFGGVAMDCPAE
jgi:N-acetylneuraminic acid mutarotase